MLTLISTNSTWTVAETNFEFETPVTICIITYKTTMEMKCSHQELFKSALEIKIGQVCGL